MGQDDSCGICGKHYQTCSHHCKSHLRHPMKPIRTICGRKADSVLIEEDVQLWVDDGIHPDDLCQVCDAHRGGLGITKENPDYQYEENFEVDFEEIR